MESRRLYLRFVLAALIVYSCHAARRECTVDGDPRGRPSHMNQESAPWLHIFTTMMFGVNGTVTRIEYFSNSSGLVYLSLWWNPNEESSYEMMGKLELITSLGYNNYEVPTDDRIQVLPGYVVGLHYPDGATYSCFTWEHPRQSSSPGILHTHPKHQKFTKYRKDDGWTVGYTVSSGRLTSRAIPIRVHTEPCEEAPQGGGNTALGPDSRSASGKDDSKQVEKQRNKTALAIGLAIPFTVLTLAAVIIGFMIWRKKYIFKTHNKVKTYASKYEPSVTYTAKDDGEDFYDLFAYYMEQSRLDDEEYYETVKSDSENITLESKELPPEVRDSGYLSEHVTRSSPDISEQRNDAMSHNSLITREDAKLDSQYSKLESTDQRQIADDQSGQLNSRKKEAAEIKKRKRQKQGKVSKTKLQETPNFSMYGDENADDVNNDVVTRTKDGSEGKDTSFGSSVDSCDLPDNSCSTNEIFSV